MRLPSLRLNGRFLSARFAGWHDSLLVQGEPTGYRQRQPSPEVPQVLGYRAEPQKHVIPHEPVSCAARHLTRFNPDRAAV